jgi:type III secretion system YscQ/HrcQ family protein
MEAAVAYLKPWPVERASRAPGITGDMPAPLTAGRLAGCSVAEAAQRSALLGRCIVVDDADGTGALWRLQWMHHGADFESTAEIAVRIGSARFTVLLQSVEGLTPLLRRGPDYQALPPVARRTLLGLACQDIVTAIERGTGQVVVIDGVQLVLRHTATLKPRLGAMLLDSRTGWCTRVVVTPADPASLRALTAWCSGWPQARGPIDVSTLPLRMRLYLGRTDVPRRSLETFAAGDFIAIGQGVVAPRQAAGIGAAAFFNGLGRSHCIGELEQSHMTIHHLDPSQQVLSDDDLVDDSSADNLEVSLRFWLADRPMTVGDVSRLQPGAIVSLGQPVALATVRLHVGIQCVGRGRLVTLGDQLGVQILNFSRHAK